MFDGEEGTCIPKSEDTFFDREENIQKGKTDITQPELVYFWTCKPQEVKDLTRIGAYRDHFDIHGTQENVSFAASGLSILEVPAVFELASQALDTEVDKRQIQADLDTLELETKALSSARTANWVQESSKRYGSGQKYRKVM